MRLDSTTPRDDLALRNHLGAAVPGSTATAEGGKCCWEDEVGDCADGQGVLQGTDDHTEARQVQEDTEPNSEDKSEEVAGEEEAQGGDVGGEPDDENTAVGTLNREVPTLKQWV